jgi:RNA polymerase sigma factor (sigma-70 family)
MEEAFLEMLNDNRSLIFKVCNMYCKDPERRRDLFQEIVLQLWKSYPGFRKASANSTWIYRVALNTAISNFRKESRRPAGISLSLQEFEIPDLGEAVAEQEQTLALQEVINQLNDIEKAIIMLYLDEKSYEEISEIIGISTSNVGVRLNRIKSKLSKLVKTY